MITAGSVTTHSLCQVAVIFCTFPGKLTLINFLLYCPLIYHDFFFFFYSVYVSLIPEIILSDMIASIKCFCFHFDA